MRKDNRWENEPPTGKVRQHQSRPAHVCQPVVSNMGENKKAVKYENRNLDSKNLQCYQ